MYTVVITLYLSAERIYHHRVIRESVSKFLSVVTTYELIIFSRTQLDHCQALPGILQ